MWISRNWQWCPIQLLSNENATEEDQLLGQMFATMVQGGADGTGLFLDTDGDGGLSSNELALLAKGDDDASTISTEDFKAVFGNQYKAGGNNVSLDGLKEIATGGASDAKNTPGSDYKDTPYGNGDQPGANGQGDPQQALVQSTLSLLGTIVQFLQGQGTGQADGTQAPKGPPANEAPVMNEPAPRSRNPQNGQSPAQGQSNPMMAFFSIISSILQMMAGMMGGQQRA